MSRLSGRIPQAQDPRYRLAPDDDHPKCADLWRRPGRAGANPGDHGGARETWKAERVSIWQAGNHDNPFGMRLTTLMISKRFPDASVPMSLLADHPNVQFNFYRHGLGTVTTEMH